MVDMTAGQSTLIAELDLRPAVTALAVDPHRGELWAAAYLRSNSADSTPWAAVRLSVPTIDRRTSSPSVQEPISSLPQPTTFTANPPHGAHTASSARPPTAVTSPSSPQAAAALPNPAIGAEVPALQTSISVQCLLGSVSFDGQWITVVKDGVGSTNKWTRRIHISDVTAVTLKKATRLFHGYIQFTVSGYAPAKASRWGPSAGRPSFDDPDSQSFTYASNQPIERLAAVIQHAISAAR